MTLQISQTALADVQRLSLSSEPTRVAQIYQIVLGDIRSQYGGAQFSINNIPNAADRDSFRWIQFAVEMNTGVRNVNTDFVRANNVVAVARETGSVISMYGPEMQASSNAVGNAFARELVQDGGAVQSLRAISLIDATNGLRSLGIEDRANWAGAVPSSAGGLILGFETDPGFYSELSLSQKAWAAENTLAASTIIGSRQLLSLSAEATDRVAGNLASIYSGLRETRENLQNFLTPLANSPCFLAGTPILLADGRTKPIEDVMIGDLVMAFDATADQGRGALVPRPVTRLYRNVTQSIIDLRGLRITPGHICLTDDGRFESIAEILLRDGMLLHADGSAIRARTGAKIGSVEDTPIRVCIADQTSGTPFFVTLRAGIPLLSGADQASSGAQSFAAYLAENGVSIAADGSLLRRDGSLLEAAQWPAGSTPFDKPMQRDWIIRDTADQPFIPDYVAALLNSNAVEADAPGDARHVVRSKAASGSLMPAAEEQTFTRSLFHEFSEVSKNLFEHGSEWVFGTSGTAALAPQQKDGWCTYNFEVQGLHTYVADDVRVHNLCNEDSSINPDSIEIDSNEDGSEVRFSFDYEDGSSEEVVTRFAVHGAEPELQSTTTVFRSTDGQVDIAQQRPGGDAEYYRAVSGNDGRPTLVAIEAEDFSAPDTSRNQPALDIEAYEINANPDGSGFEFTGTDARGATLAVEIDPGAGGGSAFYRTEEVTFASGVTVTRNYNNEGQLVSTLTGQATSDGGYREVETNSNGQ
ncbi:MAG: hypothetical protein ING16_14930, partial [Roseomonas sp.]|nr:hypothetical protein [Roseomonas sp.]